MTNPQSTDSGARLLSPAEIARYRRQLTLEGFGPDGQTGLAASHVVFIGAGGLGSPAILYLAAVGVGRITIIDDDRVEVSNLHRQVIHRNDSVGKSKVASAAAEALARNPHVEVTTVEARLNEENIIGLFSGADVVLDGSDNFATRHLASAACTRLGIPHVWASILGFDAQLSVFDSRRGPIYEDIYRTPPPPGSVPSCSEAGVLGTLVGVAGTTMAMEAVKLLTGVGNPLIGTLGYYSGLEGRWEYLPVAANPEVREEVLARAAQYPDTAPEATAVAAPIGAASPTGTTVADAEFTDAELSAEDERLNAPGTLLLDVREPGEFRAFAIPGAVNIPLSQLQEGPEVSEELAQRFAESTRAVVYCAAGARSETAIPLLEQAFNAQESADLKVAEADSGGSTAPGAKLHNLPGGINAWLDRQG